MVKYAVLLFSIKQEKIVMERRQRKGLCKLSETKL